MKTSKSENNLSSLIKKNNLMINELGISPNKNDNNQEYNKSKPINIVNKSVVNRYDIYKKSNDIDELNENNNNNTLNYSLYVENNISISKSPDYNISSIVPKRNDKWVDSNIIQRCQDCDIGFGLFYRKHHCRACGGVFCGNCCNKYINIPTNIIKKPTQDIGIKLALSNSLRWLYGERKDLVCNICDKRVKDLKDVDYLIKIFEYLDLETLYITKLVSKNFRTASIHILSKFRDIQYGTHLKIYNSWEQYILWLSKDYLINHNIWLTVLIKSVIQYTQCGDYNRIQIIEGYIKNILNNKINKNNNKNCIELLCSRKCNNNLDYDDITEILDYIRFSIKNDENLLDCYNIKNIIIYLVNLLLKFNQLEIIFPILSNILNFLFDYEQINLDNNFTNQICKSFFKYNNLNNVISLICYEKYFIDSYNNDILNINHDMFLNLIMKYIALNYSSKLLNDILKMTISINNILYDKISNIDFPFIYPFDTEYMITKINSVNIISSTTKPYLVNVDIINKNNNIRQVKFIIKKDKSLRKEQLISSLINILLNKLNDIEYYNIPSYRIIMLNKEIGLIEYIEDANTLRSISEKGFTLQNYILNMNQNNTLHIIKTRFAQSLAISSAIAYIIGLGDRHLDNIMINSRGQIFHIDYGYIMENPIKLFNTPEIKLTTDIIDFLGGTNSIYYNEFKKLIVKIYNLYRANKNILYIYFKYICESKYLDWDTVSTKLDTKLMIGMKCKDVEITLINEIDSSNGIKDILSDMCHSYRQKIFS